MSSTFHGSSGDLDSSRKPRRRKYEVGSEAKRNSIAWLTSLIGGHSDSFSDSEASPLPSHSHFDMAGNAFGASHMYKSFFKVALGATVTLYILNQKHMLPKPLSRIVSKALFWPTLPITVGRRIGKWMTDIDDTVVLGGAPVGFAHIPEAVRKKKGCTGVINLCEEYPGPLHQYEKLGINQLWLPTVDHFEPSFEDYKKAVSYLQAYENAGERVYVHCRAGHGRSAAVVFAWLLYKNPKADPAVLNRQLYRKRDVRKELYKQENIRKFHSWLKNGGKLSISGSAGLAQFDTSSASEDTSASSSFEMSDLSNK